LNPIQDLLIYKFAVGGDAGDEANADGPRTAAVGLRLQDAMTILTEEEMPNRKLIRPSLSELKEQLTVRQTRRKQIPSDQTNAENFYYAKQMQNRTPMVIILGDGEQIDGAIEWYDKNSIKVNRQSEPNLLILKHNIKYMYKANEAD
jgi:host factor-I protein